MLDLDKGRAGIAFQTDGAACGNSTVVWSNVIYSGTCLLLRIFGMSIPEKRRVVAGHEAKTWSRDRPSTTLVC